mmetsp:Transcript_16604/g.15954  ORF Transcript_16604/g.15954 Transcript_16604/m.15954 type:complete len:451 (+) Transcript_16604:103-1455(+)
MEEIWSKDFSQDDWNKITQFSSVVKKVASIKDGIYSTDYNMSSFSDMAGINLFSYPKEGLMMHALWVIFFSHLKNQIPRTALKYPTVTSFLVTYQGKFSECSSENQSILCDTANLMVEMFKYLPARKNKGLAIQMIPKLVEGWHAKYVTGSGQTKATADRVFIFQTEGGVQPAHRGGRVSAPKKLPNNKSKRSAILKRFEDDSSLKKRKTKRSFRSSPRDWHRYNEEEDLTTDDGDYCPEDNCSESSSSGSHSDYYSQLEMEKVDATIANVITSVETCVAVDTSTTIPTISLKCPSNSSDVSDLINVFNYPSVGPSEAIPENQRRNQPQGSQSGGLGPLGPANFQPLFDFTLIGGISPRSPRVPSPRIPTTNGLQCEQKFTVPVPRPPILKRAHSWETDYVEGGAEDNERKKNEIESNLNGEKRNSCMIKIHKGHAKPTFLFDAYLQSHP